MSGRDHDRTLVSWPAAVNDPDYELKIGGLRACAESPGKAREEFEFRT